MYRFHPINLLKKVLGFGAERPPRVSGAVGREIELVRTDTGPPGGYDQDLAWAHYQQQMELEVERAKMYREFDLMDDDDIISAALELYCDDACQVDIQTNKTVWAKSANPDIEEAVNGLLDRINVEDDIFALIRELAKYGDSFSGILLSSREDGTPSGVWDIIPVQPSFVHRHEDELHRLQGFSLGAQPNEDKISHPWDYVHWRLRGKRRGSKYGYSILAPARRPYRRLRMAEDALLIYRLRRAPDRFVFKFKGLANMSVADRIRIMNRYRTEIRKKQLIDPATGTIRAEMDPLAIDMDIFVDNDLMDVDRLAGSAQVNTVMDIDYFRKRLFSCLRIPPDYMGFVEARGGFISKSPLVEQDIQFARGVKRLQRAGIEGFIRLAQIDLAWRGIDTTCKENEFTIHMMPVSYLDELRRAELAEIRSRIIGHLKEIGKNLEVDQAAWISYVAQMSGLPDEVVHGVGEDAVSAGLQGKLELSEEAKQGLAKLIESNSSLRSLIKDALYRGQQSSTEVKPDGPLPADGEEGIHDPETFSDGVFKDR